jgi:hypothetical protein
VGGRQVAVVGPGGIRVGRKSREAADFVPGETAESGEKRGLGGKEGEVGASPPGTRSIGEALPGRRRGGKVKGVEGRESAFSWAAGVEEERVLRMKIIL